MIKNLQLRFGSNPTATPLNFDPGSVTVFVGPNNSGKSLILREIENFLRRESRSNIEGNHIIQGITLEDLSRDDVVDFVRPNNPNIALENIVANITVAFRGINIFNRDSPVIASHEIRIKDLESENIGQKLDIKRVIAAANTIRLDGSTRLNLTNAVEAGGTDEPPKNLLDSIRKNPDARKKIRDITFDAFGYYFVINPRAMLQLRVGMSPRAPSATEEQSLEDEGKIFHKSTVPIEEFSDGIKAYAGIIAAIFSGNFKLLLIDEPEAFLHPPLARKLGGAVGKRAAEQQGHVLVSTHSSDFLLGCVQSGSPVNVVRLTYDKGKNIAGARLLPSAKLQTMMRDPLLRSTGVLTGLFHQGVIVCEGNIDRVLYEEINNRLIDKNRGASDTLFVNSISKQTLCTIAQPLRELGIPAAIVVDLDIIKKGRPCCST